MLVSAPRARFVEERKLHTTIKLNPTLLGDEGVRGILNDKLGFKTQVPDLAFDHDLKYPDGVALIKSLKESAQKQNAHLIARGWQDSRLRSSDQSNRFSWMGALMRRKD